MNKEDIMLINEIINVGAVNLNSPEVRALGDKVELIVKQINTQEALNDIMLELEKINAPKKEK